MRASLLLPPEATSVHCARPRSSQLWRGMCLPSIMKPVTPPADYLSDKGWVCAFEKPKGNPAAFVRPSTTVLRFGCSSASPPASPSPPAAARPSLSSFPCQPGSICCLACCHRVSKQRYRFLHGNPPQLCAWPAVLQPVPQVWVPQPALVPRQAAAGEGAVKSTGKTLPCRPLGMLVSVGWRLWHPCCVPATSACQY